MRKTSNMKNKIKILFVAILMLASVFLISAGDIIFKAGNLDVSNNLAVNTDTLYVDSANKKVGIGTTSPRGRLQIGDLSSTLGLPTYPGDIILDKDPGGSNGIGGIEFRSSVSAGGAGWKITATGNYLGHKLLFAPRSAGATWETEVLTLTQNGNVGIGLTDPGAVLEVSGGENKLSIIRMVQRSSGAAAYGLDVGLDPTTGDPVFSRIVNNVVTEVFRIQRSTGNVGIGTTSPTEKLQVAGNIKANQFITGDITFNKNDKPVWRMYEDEDGLYVESLTTGKNYRVVLEEIK